MEIESIINNIDLILNYFLPGYLYIKTKNYCINKEVEIDNIGKVLDTVFISIVLEKLLYIIFKLPKIFGLAGIAIKFTGKHNNILALSILGIGLGYISSRNDIYEIKKKIRKKLNIIEINKNE